MDLLQINSSRDHWYTNQEYYIRVPGRVDTHTNRCKTIFFFRNNLFDFEKSKKKFDVNDKTKMITMLIIEPNLCWLCFRSSDKSQLD